VKRFSLLMSALLSLTVLAGCSSGGDGGAAVAPDVGGGDGVSATPTTDSYRWTGNTRFVVFTPGVLGNDPAGSVVADAGVRNTALGGSVEIAGNGSFTYLPPVGAQNVIDTFTYEVAGFAPVTVSVDLVERIWFVKNDNPGGIGTFLDPFATLAEAEAAADEFDTIFVFAGDFTDTGQDRGIKLKTGQRLLGVGVGLRVEGIPLVDAAPPNSRISNAALAEPGDIPVVMLTADATAGNEVAGMTIEAAFNDGILATAGSGHDVHNNIITFDPANGREGIRLLAVSGENAVIANTITGSPRDGIRLANNEDLAGDPAPATPVTATVTVSRNTITGSARDGIAAAFDGADTAMTLNLLTNTIAGSGEEGIDVNSTGTAGITATVSRNRVSASAVEGIRMVADGASVMDALALDNALSANGGNADFRATAVTTGAASVCLELENNSNVSPDSGQAGDSTFLVENTGGAAFAFFEAQDNDTPAVRDGVSFADVLPGACGIVPPGRELFGANCAICHRGNGMGFGNVGPDITDRTAAEIRFQLISNPSMSNIRLTEREVNAIAGALSAF
jgi:hypothetical protein